MADEGKAKPKTKPKAKGRAGGGGKAAPESAMAGALKAAVFVGSLDKVEAVIAAGAAVDGRDDTGNTALHWAAYKGFPEVARLLVSYGANAARKNAQGQTPVQVAERRKQ